MRDGESLVQQHANTGHFATPYKFNAKELDMETGNYYYGARYYNPQVSVWLSVDPLSHLSPNQTPFHFVSNNPIMRIDPNGLTDIEGPNGECGHIEDGNNIGVIKLNEAQWKVFNDNSNFEVTVTLSSEPNIILKNEESIRIANYLRNTLFFGPIHNPVPNPFFRADAIAIDGGAIFLGQEYDAGFYLVLNGEDVGSVIPFKESANGGGSSAAVGVEVGRVDYFGSESFNTNMLFGPRDKWQADVAPFGEGFAVGIGFSNSTVNDFGSIYTTNVQISFGASPEPFLFFAWNRGNVKPW
jgi:RHS repeat-associated protein